MIRLFQLLIVLVSSFGFSQEPVIEWQKSLGGSMNDWAYSIEQTSDGGYIVAGDSDSNDGDVTGNHGGKDCWVVKLDESGNITWQKSLGGSGDDGATSVQQTTDGGYIVSAVSSSNDGDVTINHGGEDYWVIKLDAFGNITWQKSLGGSGYDVPTSAQQTMDGGYIAAGMSSSTDGDITNNYGMIDYWVVKLDAFGNLIWEKSFGGSGDDRAASILETTNGGFIIVGNSNSSDGDVTENKGGIDSWVVKLDEFGNLIWEYSFGGSGLDQLGSVQETTDGGYIIAGSSNSNDGDVTLNYGGIDYWVIKLDESGNLVWQKSFGGSSNELALSIQQTTDGGYIVAGFSSSTDGDVIGNNGTRDYWVIKLDELGNLTWQKCYGGTSADWAFSIQQTVDDGYIIAGESYSNNGDVSGNNGSSDFWILKLSYTSSIDDAVKLKVNVYPTPTTNQLNLSVGSELIGTSFIITDNNGRTVIKEVFYSNQQMVDFSFLENGIYFLRLKENGETIKLIKH